MSILRYFLILLFSLCFVFSNAPTFAAEKAETVTLQLFWKHQFQFAGYYAAKEMGFYKEVGLDVNIREYQSGMDVNEEVLSGRAQFATVSSSATKAYLQGKPVKLLANIFKHSALVLLSRRDAGIRTPGDLYGKRLMLTAQERNAVEFLSFFAKNGIDPKKLSYIDHNFDPMAIVNGQADVMSAYITNQPFILQQKGIPYNILDPAAYGVDFYGDSLITSAKLSEQRPELVEAFKEASLRGWTYALQHPEEIIELISSKYNTTNKSREALRYEAKETAKLILPETYPLGSIDPERVRRIANAMYEAGVIKDEPDLKFLIFGLEPKSKLPLTQSDVALTDLTPAEQAWLEAHPQIHVGIMNAWPPLNYVDEAGVPRGIGVDYLNAINKRLGGVLNVVPASFKENLDAVKSKSLDALMDITPKPDREPFFNFTTPYLTIPQIIVGHKDKPYFSGDKDLYGKTVALESGYYTIKRFKHDHPEIKIREYMNTSDCLDAVSRGEADAYVGNRAVAIYLMEKELITNLRVMGRTSQPPVPLAFGIRKDWPELAEILNKALGSLSPQEVQEIHRKCVPVAAVFAEPPPPEQVQFDQAKFLLQSLGAIFACIAVIIAIVWLMKGRPRQLSIRDTLLLISFVFASLIVSSAAFVIMLLESQRQYHAIETWKVESLNLALELKQSSDDLTRFARTYVVTGDPKYEHYFQTIIAIRDGKQAHPKKFTRSYWDHVAAGVVELDQDGEMYSIEQRITDLGFSDEEREKLSVAKKESDDLINLEDVAMNAVKGLYKNDNGQFTIKGEPDMAMARKLLHGKEYHDAKARIMKPVDQFFSLLEWRTAGELNLVRQRNQTIILGITVLIAITIGFSIYFFFLLRRRIISPLAVLKAGAQTIKRGDYSHHIDLTSKDEVGALAKVFNSMTHRIEKRTAELAEAEERSRLLLESVGDGVFGVDTKGNIIFINPIAYRMLGYSSEELLGMNVHDTTHYSHADGSSYPQDDCPMYKAYTEGRAFSVDDEVLWHKDGTNFPVEYSATPIGHGETTAGVVVVFRDITERRQAEEKLVQNMEELERFGKLAVGREERMIKLKKEINELLRGLGQPDKYKIVD